MQTDLTEKLEGILEAEDVRSDAYKEAPRTRVSFRSTPVFLSQDDYDPTMPEVGVLWDCPLLLLAVADNADDTYRSSTPPTLPVGETSATLPSFPTKDRRPSRPSTSS